MTPTYDVQTLPATPASAERRAELLDDGYSESRVAGTLTFRKRAGAVVTPTAVPAPDEEPSSDAELVSLVGDRPARALASAGLGTVARAQEMAAADPDRLASTPGIGPATLRKLAG